MTDDSEEGVRRTPRCVGESTLQRAEAILAALLPQAAPLLGGGLTLSKKQMADFASRASAHLHSAAYQPRYVRAGRETGLEVGGESVTLALAAYLASFSSTLAQRATALRSRAKPIFLNCGAPRAATSMFPLHELSNFRSAGRFCAGRGLKVVAATVVAAAAAAAEEEK